MGLIILLDAQQSFLMLASLVLALGLTLWETREQQFSTKTTMWWLLLVALAHFPAYFALRIYVAVRHRQRQT